MISWGFRKRQKYGAKTVKTDGMKFDSTGEWRRWLELKLLEKAGEIHALERQRRFKLEVNGVHVCDYVADFCYFEDTLFQHHIVEDFKSLATMTPIFAIKRKLMLACHGIEIRVTGRGIKNPAAASGKGVKQATEPATVRAARSGQ